MQVRIELGDGRQYVVSGIRSVALDQSGETRMFAADIGSEGLFLMTQADAPEGNLEKTIEELGLPREGYETLSP